MNTHNTVLHNRGFISVAALLIMMASLSVVMAIVYRSAQGGVITRNLKQSNQAYQQGDYVVEKLIQDIQEVDNNSYLGLDTKIPDGISALPICNAVSGVCYTIGSHPVTDNTVMINDVMQVSASSNVSGTERSLQVPVPERVPIPTITDVTGTTTGLVLVAIPGKVTISWKALESYTDTENQNKLKQYDKLEVRRAEITTADDALSPDELLSKTDLTWERVGDRVDAGAATSSPTAEGTIVPSDTTLVDDTTVSAGKTYAYIIKATNKNPLKLDSYYSLPEKITTP